MILKWHKKQLDWFQDKLGMSNYTIAWIGFLKGLVLGLFIYHFLSNNSYL